MKQLLDASWRIGEALVLAILVLGLMLLPAPPYQPVLAHQAQPVDQSTPSSSLRPVSSPTALPTQQLGIIHPSAKKSHSVSPDIPIQKLNSVETPTSQPPIIPTLKPTSILPLLGVIDTPTPRPNFAETLVPLLSQTPTLKPSSTPIPTKKPTNTPTLEPTTTPTPTRKPTPAPTKTPTSEPTPRLSVVELLNQQVNRASTPIASLPSETGDWGIPQYYFPYPATSIKVTRGGLGHYSEYGPAYDFAGGFGTPVLASRSGTVVGADYSNHDPHCKLDVPANQVIIDHGDGTYGVYLHFAHSDPIVKKGDEVSVGTIIGYTGCTGNADGPHIHFHVSDYFNANNSKDFGYLSHRIEIWFFEAGEGEWVPPLNVYEYDIQWMYSKNPGQGLMPPVGDLTFPFDGAVIKGPLKINGWAVSQAEIDRVEVWLDNNYINQANYDVFDYDPNAICGNCDYDWEIDSTQYKTGGHILTVKIYDKAGNHSQENRYIIFAQ